MQLYSLKLVLLALADTSVRLLRYAPSRSRDPLVPLGLPSARIFLGAIAKQWLVLNRKTKTEGGGGGNTGGGGGVGGPPRKIGKPSRGCLRSVCCPSSVWCLLLFEGCLFSRLRAHRDPRALMHGPRCFDILERNDKRGGGGQVWRCGLPAVKHSASFKYRTKQSKKTQQGVE